MRKNLTFTKAVLASTFFALNASSLHAGLVPIITSTTTTATPDFGQGYDFLVVPNLTLTVTDGYQVGSSFIALLGLSASIDVGLPILGSNETVNFAGNATVKAAIGPSNPVTTMNLQTANDTVNFQGNITSVTTNFAANATANLSDTVIITGNVDNTSTIKGTGILQFQGGGQVTGSIGNSEAIGLININSLGGVGKTVELDGGVINTTTIKLNDDGSGASANGTTLKLNNAAMVLTANITATTNNEDTLDVTNAADLIGNIGQNGQALNLIKVGLHNNTAISGNIFATTTQFQGNNVLSLNDGNIITGAVDTTTPNTGTLQFQGGGQVTGNIGNTNALSLLTINSLQGPNKQVELDGVVIKINTINTMNNGVNPTTLLLNSLGVMSLTGNIAPGNSNNLDILNVANLGATTLTGNIGASAKAFNLVKVGQNNNTTINGNVIATTTQFQANNTLSMADASTITGAVDTLASGTGILQFQGGGRITGNIGNANPLGLISINSAASLNKTVELDGAVIRANAINIIGNGANPTTLLLNGPGVMALTGNISTNGNMVDILNITNTGVTTITGNIGGLGHAFATINVGKNANTTINGNVYATLMQFQGNNIVNLNGNFTGAINSSTAGVGTLQFLGNSTVSGDIGDAPLAAVNITGAGSVVNFQGNVIANAVNFLADATANLSDGKAISGPLMTSLNGQGTLVFLGASTIQSQIGANGAALKALSIHGGSGKTVILNNNVFALNTTVDNGGTLFVDPPQTINGNLTISNGSVLSLTTDANPLTVTGNFNLAGGTTLALNMANMVASGSVDVLGIATVNGSSQVNIINPPANIPGGKAVITIVTDASGGGANLNVIPVTSSSLFTNFVTQVNGNLLQLVVTTKSATPSSGSFQGSSILNAINALINANLSGSLEDLINQLGLFTDEQMLLNALNEVAPVVDGGILYESFETQRQAFDVVEERAAKIHYCRRYPERFVCKRPHSGISSGDWQYTDDGDWIKVFGYKANQSERQKINGYKNHMEGLAFGVDSMFGDISLVGVAFSWASLDLHRKEMYAKTKVNSYQETIYGNYEFNNPLFLNWAIGLAYNSYHSNRDILFGDLTLSPSGKFHGWQTGAKAEFGYDIENDFIHTIPLLSFYYSHLALSEYTERGANTADQQVNASKFNLFLVGAGVKFVYDYTYDNILYQPEAHMTTFYDFVGDKMEVTSQFVGAGPNFQTVGFTPARSSLNLGASISAFTDKGFISTLSVDWNTKEDYNAFAAYLKLRYEW